MSPATVLPYQKKKYRVAFAITITKDGFFQDGAAVLAYSIIKVSQDRNYEVSFIAFVHPNVTEARPLLRKIGFQLSHKVFKLFKVFMLLSSYPPTIIIVNNIVITYSCLLY